jgi:hypothetical protein
MADYIISNIDPACVLHPPDNPLGWSIFFLLNIAVFSLLTFVEGFYV